MDRTKKSRIFIVVVLILTVLVFVWVFAKQFKKIPSLLTQSGKQQASNEELFKTLPEVKCQFSADEDVMGKAVENQSPEGCVCFEESEARERCEKIVTESIYYQQALNQYDERICQNISQPEGRKSCLSGVVQAKEYLIAKDPGFLGNQYLLNGNLDEAIKAFEKAFSGGTKKSENLLSLALAYANKALAEHKENELVPKALQLAEEAAGIDSKNPEVFRVLGYIYEIKPDFGKAEENYNKALEIDNNYILAYLGRGHVYSLMSKPGFALDDFNKAKELDKNKQYPQIYANLCRLKLSSPDVEGAIKDCLANVEISPDSLKGEANGMLVELYLRAGRYDEAMAKVGVALAYSPNNPAIYVTAAKVQNNAGRYEEAIANAEKALKFDNMRALAYSQITYAKFKQTKLEEAAKAGEKGMELVDQDPSILAHSKSTAKFELANLLTEIYQAQGNSSLENKYKDLSQSLK